MFNIPKEQFHSPLAKTLGDKSVFDAVLLALSPEQNVKLSTPETRANARVIKQLTSDSPIINLDRSQVMWIQDCCLKLDGMISIHTDAFFEDILSTKEEPTSEKDKYTMPEDTDESILPADYAQELEKAISEELTLNE